MFKLYKAEGWKRKPLEEGLRQLTGGTKIEEEKNPFPAGFEPGTKNIQKRVLPPPGFNPQSKSFTQPGSNPKTTPATALPTEPPRTEQKLKGTNKNLCRVKMVVQ